VQKHIHCRQIIPQRHTKKYNQVNVILLELVYVITLIDDMYIVKVEEEQ
jgi:hypothetical protein